MLEDPLNQPVAHRIVHLLGQKRLPIIRAPNPALARDPRGELIKLHKNANILVIVLNSGFLILICKRLFIFLFSDVHSNAVFDKLIQGGSCVEFD